MIDPKVYNMFPKPWFPYLFYLKIQLHATFTVLLYGTVQRTICENLHEMNTLNSR